MTKRQQAEPVAILYCRVSAVDSQSESDVSLDAQERTLRALADVAGYSNVLVIKERHTASKSQPELERALAMLERGHAVALYAAKIDRLSRKGARDVLRIADLAERYGWRLVVADVALDTATPVGRLVLTVLAGIAEFESKRRSERMREYHGERKQRGERAGVHYGRCTTASAAAQRRIERARTSGVSWRGICDMLNADGVDGRTWHPTAVRRTWDAMQRSA